MPSASLLPLWAIHISDGVLSGPWLAGGFLGLLCLAGGALLADWILRVRQGREFRDEEIVEVALLTAAFFLASQLHVRLGPSSVHLLLNGLLGVCLRWRAALAIPVGLLLQAAFFGHGGFTTLGVNSCVLVLPALVAWLLFTGLHQLPWVGRPWFRGGLVAFSFLLWNLCLVYSVTLVCTNRFSLSLTLDPRWANAVTFHPATLMAILLVSVTAAFLEKRLHNPPEFPLGLLVGVVAVLLTSILNCLVLVCGCGDDLESVVRSVVLLAFVAHLPVAAIEGVVLGFTVGFLARVKPALLGLPASCSAGTPASARKVTTAPATLHPGTPPTAPAQR